MAGFVVVIYPGALDRRVSLKLELWKNLMKITTIDLMRHGEPIGGKKYRGQSNDPLSGKGWEQMWAAVGIIIPGSILLPRLWHVVQICT